ncbi:phosphoadenylyl-sulfate reductase [Fictibacillus sp. NRS-1165]|uniref:phosphoadenylyl-sulfate reductase n=1 Tax=Fictibacillus sp. NRS-1165 TaxID=3144463 RepID=UPI003D20192B
MAELSYKYLTDKDYTRINNTLAGSSSLDIIKWAYETFKDELVYACSFGAEGMVILDLISKVRPDAKVIFLDTNVHFKETYELIDRVKQKYPCLQIELLQPALSIDEQAVQYGDALWKRNPDLCCSMRKLEPLEKILNTKKAWMSGLRRDQSPTRANTQFINKDDRFSSIKICPLIHWKWEDVWDYIYLNQLPYNTLHKSGYPSIGCIHCTLPVNDGSHLRAGRWTGLNKTECGLHLKTSKNKE